MTQMTEPQPPQTPTTEQATAQQTAEPTIEWYGPSMPGHETTAQFPAPITSPDVFGAGNGQPPSAPRKENAGRPRWVDIAVAAVVAALVSGGVTAGVLAANDDGTVNVA